MRTKFRSIGRVAIALVLALSLTLVMAVPVAATHTSTAAVAFDGAESTVAGEASILDVTVTNDGASACAINIVKIDFSESDFAVTGAGIDPTGWTGSLDGDVVTYTAATADDYIATSGNEIFSPAVTNPQIFGEATVPAVLTTDVGSKAALTAAENTGWIGYEADSVGISGNAITVEYADPFAEDSPLSVSVDGRAITVSLATDEIGDLTSTASEVATAINGDVDAGALVDATADSGNLDYVVLALTDLDLTGGVSRNVDKAATVTPATLTVTSIIPTSFEVIAGADNIVTVGEAFSVKITALTGETIETKYAGAHMIDFTYIGDSPTGIAPLFELITFIDGVGTSPASFVLTDTDQIAVTITATDEQAASGISEAITINPAVGLHHFTISGEAGVVAGVAFASNITVTAYDAESNIKTDYVGMVSWSSSDPTATTGSGLPANYTFVAGDEGVKAFDKADFILKTSGPQTITVTDAVADVEKESISIAVTAADATALEVESDVAVIRADATDTATITVSAVDAYGNVDTSITSTDKVTFTASLGDIDVSAEVDFTNGEATNTLTSNDVGTATIKVTHSTQSDVTWPYATTTVELVAATAVTEVWVDDDYDAATNDGGHDWSINAFDNITDGVAAVATGGTVNVLPGTYTPSATIGITTVGLTLKSTGGAAVTIIASSAAQALQIIADDVTVEGFTFEGSGSQWGIWIAPRPFTEGVTVKDNIFTEFVDHAAITLQSGYFQDSVPPLGGVTEATISGNVISGCKYGINLLAGANNNTVSGNTITGCTEASAGAIWLVGGDATHKTQGNTISGNTITSNAGYGIWLRTLLGEVLVGTFFDDNVIEGNTISLNGKAGIQVDSGLTVTELTITGNDITDNTGDGIKIGTLWDSSNAISNNNIYGNPTGDTTNYNIASAADIHVDAENNWWGTAIESAIKVTLSGNIDYSPWLDALYSVPTDPVTTIDLVAGWNLISLPLYIPAENRDPATLLAGVTGVEIVWGNYDPSTGGWNTYVPDQTNDLTAMRDGGGYWVDMAAADSLDVSALGTELPEAPAAPPTYDVVEGWNLIGFKSTTAKAASSYLLAIEDQYTMIYGFADGAYFVVQTTDNLEPGYGYWIAVTVLGTIYP